MHVNKYIKLDCWEPFLKCLCSLHDRPLHWNDHLPGLSVTFMNILRGIQPGYLRALGMCVFGQRYISVETNGKKTSCEIFSIFNCIHIDCCGMFSLFIISFIFFFCDLIAFVLSEICLKLIILIYKFCGSCYPYWSNTR